MRGSPASGTRRPPTGRSGAHPVWSPMEDAILRACLAFGATKRDAVASISMANGPDGAKRTLGAVRMRTDMLGLAFPNPIKIVWTPEHRALLRRLIASGKGRQEIADSLRAAGFSGGLQAVRAEARRLGLRFRPDTRFKWSDARLAELRRHRRAGRSTTQIAALMGEKVEAIRSAIAKHDCGSGPGVGSAVHASGRVEISLRRGLTGSEVNALAGVCEAAGLDLAAFATRATAVCARDARLRDRVVAGLGGIVARPAETAEDLAARLREAEARARAAEDRLDAVLDELRGDADEIGRLQVAYGLSPRLARALGVLARRDLASREAVQIAMASGVYPETDLKGVDVAISNLRRALPPRLVIEAVWGTGFRLAQGRAEVRGRMRGLEGVAA